MDITSKNLIIKVLKKTVFKMTIEIDENFYEIMSWSKDYIQVQGTVPPYRIYAPPHYDIAALKQYVKRHSPIEQKAASSYFYMEHPYYVFNKPYLVKICYTATPAHITLKSTHIRIEQRKNANTSKLLKNWSKELLYNELINLISYWEERLEQYDIKGIHIKTLPTSYYKIKGDDIMFSSRLIELDKEQINLLILAAFCQFKNKTKKESEATFNLYLPAWKDLQLF